MGEKEEKKGSEVIETIKNFSDLVMESLKNFEDIATQEVMLPIETRIEHRLESVRKMSSAQHRKIMGQWKTIPPKMHIMNLKARKTSNNEGEISFDVFDMDDKGNKIIKENKTVVTLNNGDKVERVTSAEYVIRFAVKEIIKYGKPIMREKIDLTR
jgi:hypothetical protein